MVNIKVKKSVYCILLLLLIASHFAAPLYGSEQELKVLFKGSFQENPRVSIVDIDGDKINEVIVSAEGYIRILKWDGKTFVEKWKTPQFKYVFSYSAFGKIFTTKHDVSKVFPVQYRSGNRTKESFLFFVHTAQREIDIYELSWRNKQYAIHKVSKAPFNWFETIGKCSDHSTVILGVNYNPSGNRLAAYKWDGSTLAEKWRIDAKTETLGIISGAVLVAPTARENIFLLINGGNNILSCEDNKYDIKKIEDTLTKFSQIDIGHSILGITKKGSMGELWTIKTPKSEGEYYAMPHVSQFNGKEFFPFTRVQFKGIVSDMITNIAIVDLDDDGIGEILGVEVKATQMGPPEEEEGIRLKNVRTNLFMAKWNGREYQVYWHKLATTGEKSMLRQIEMSDVIGDGKKEIIATDDDGYLYIFQLPDIQ